MGCSLEGELLGVLVRGDLVSPSSFFNKSFSVVLANNPRFEFELDEFGGDIKSQFDGELTRTRFLGGNGAT